MRPAASVLASVLFTLSLAACIPPGTQVALTNSPPRAMHPRAATEVAVFVGRRPVDEHVDVAILEPAQAGSYGAQLSDVVAAVRRRAGELGCDGVVIEGTRPVWASCVVFTAAPAVAMAPSPSPTPSLSPSPSPTPSLSPSPSPSPSRSPSPSPAPARPARLAPATAPGVVLERLFPRLDRDHNGRLGPDELPKSSQALIRRIDTNGDGWVTAYELRRFNQAEAR
jgi:hypothetical protein